ncbi:hypothetical protein VTK56DRAFT_8475 [Thermocarpiscus australiensis]
MKANRESPNKINAYAAALSPLLDHNTTQFHSPHRLLRESRLKQHNERQRKPIFISFPRLSVCVVPTGREGGAPAMALSQRRPLPDDFPRAVWFLEGTPEGRRNSAHARALCPARACRSFCGGRRGKRGNPAWIPHTPTGEMALLPGSVLVRCEPLLSHIA